MATLAAFRAEAWRGRSGNPAGPWPLVVRTAWRRLLQQVERGLQVPVTRRQLRRFRNEIEAELHFTRLRFGPPPDYVAERWAALRSGIDRHLRPPTDPSPSRDWPLPPQKITSEYGWRRDPFTAERSFHAGIDLAGTPGQVVAAAASGRVEFVGWKGAHGRVVVLKHTGGWSTLYGHLKRAVVSAGMRVEAGSPVGLVGSTGRSTGPHLHFEVRRNDRPVPPREFLWEAPARSGPARVP